MIVALIIFSIVFAIISGISKAIIDLSEEEKIKGNPLFWHKNKAWKNKWKLDANDNPILVNGKRVEKRFGSSRWFVAFYDAWHLFGLIERIGFIVTYTSLGLLISINNWYWFGLFLYPLSMLVFHIFYTTKILRK